MENSKLSIMKQMKQNKLIYHENQYVAMQIKMKWKTKLIMCNKENHYKTKQFKPN